MQVRAAAILVAVIVALRKGVKLVLEEWDHSYTLYGTGVAVPTVEDCFTRYR